MNFPSISYAILTHNEDESLDTLLNAIHPYKKYEDEIVFVDDHSTNEKTLKILSKYPRVYKRHMNRDYAAQKNYLNSKCRKDYIFQLDADEFPSKQLISNVKKMLIENPTIELFGIPRANIIKGLTTSHIKKWRWKPDIYNRLNYPDYQGRLYKNEEKLIWYRPLHEHIIGNKTLFKIKQDTGYDIIHYKTVERQLESNDRYYNNYNEDGSIKET